jgi:Ser/Thr protein kinase RdoA (MazF antagonist)
MVDAFTPDIFSVSTPTFHVLPEAKAAQIAAILSEHYPDRRVDPRDIAQAGGLEINSNNFRFTDRSETFLLKRAGMTAKRAVLNAQFQVSQTLRKRGVPFPAAVPNLDGNVVSRDSDGTCWILTQFVDGTYFAGGRSELLNVGKGIGLLQRHLHDQASSDLTASNSLDAISYFQASVARLFDSRQYWHEFFPEQAMMLLAEDEALLEKTAARIVDTLPRLAQLPSEVCHFDLHPHNILVRSGKLAAFVDIDSLQINRRALAIAFSTFKLVRQHAVHLGLAVCDKAEIAEAAAEFVGAIREGVDFLPSELESMEDLAMFEVFRRILIITDLNIVGRDITWNRVLNMQLAALREIPIIFARLSGQSARALT